VTISLSAGGPGLAVGILVPIRGRRGLAPVIVRNDEVVACWRVRVCREMYRLMPGRRGSMGLPGYYRVLVVSDLAVREAV
jgi:hypothetical protein